MTTGVFVIRVYEDSGRSVGEHRILVDRLWPRGRSRAVIDIDEWVKDASPSPDLRTWYSHDVNRFAEFADRYRQELGRAPGALVVARLRELSHSQRLVLLTATKDIEHSSAEILRQVIAAPPQDVTSSHARH